MQQIKDVKTFIGGMDKDTDIGFLGNGKYRDAKNARIGQSIDGRGGVLQNLLGVHQIYDQGNLSLSNYEMVGMYSDEKNNNIYMFMYDGDFDVHKIIKYDIDSDTFTNIISTSVLGFSPSYPITSIDLVENMLFWTAGNTHPMMTDVNNAMDDMIDLVYQGTGLQAWSITDGYSVGQIVKHRYSSSDNYIIYICTQTVVAFSGNSPTGTYGTNSYWESVDTQGITEDYLTVIKAPPMYPPEVNSYSDSNYSGNNVTGYFFQFKYRFVYSNNQKSVYSPISKVSYTPNDYLDPESGADSTTHNALMVTMRSAGSNNSVESIEVVARVGNNGDFKSIKKIDVISTFLDDGGFHDFAFFNNGIYTNIPLNESNQIYDDVPLTAKTQEFAENRLMYGNVKSGYDQTTPDYEVIPSYTDAPTSLYEFENALSTDKTILTDSDGSTLVAFFTAQGYSMSVGDRVIIEGVNTLTDAPPFYESEFGYVDVTIRPGWDAADLVEAILTYEFGIYDKDLTENWSISIPLGIMTYSNQKYRVSVVASGQHNTCFKSGSWYDVAIQYYDRYGRTNGTQTNENARIYIESIPERSGIVASSSAKAGKANIIFKTNNTPPSWAVYYSILYSRATTVYDSTYVTVIEATMDTANGIDHLVLNVGSIQDHHADYPHSSLAFTFEVGDRVRFITVGTGGATDTADTDQYAETMIDTEIIDSGLDGTEQTITIAQPSEITHIDEAKGALIEIYRPGKVLDADENIFFETDEFFPISSGNHGGDVSQDGSGSIYPTGTYDGALRDGIEFISGVGFFVNVYYEDAGYDIDVGESLTISGLSTYAVEGVVYHETYMRVQIATGLPGSDPSLRYYTQTDTTDKPAIVVLSQGDAYYRRRELQHEPGGATSRESFMIESLFIGDFDENSKQANIGRPSAILNVKQEQRFATIFYTEKFIPNTDINNLNRIYPDVNFEEYDRNFGDIGMLNYDNGGMTMLQEHEVSKILVNKAVTYDAQGNANYLGTSNQVLSTAIPYQGRYGIQKDALASFVVHGMRKYWIDLYRGVALRLSANGIEEISRYGMQGEISETCKDALTSNNTLVSGMYDPIHNEYRVSFDNKSEALAFNEPLNIWTTYVNDDKFRLGKTCRMRSFYSANQYGAYPAMYEINASGIDNGTLTEYHWTSGATIITYRNLEVSIPSNIEPVELKNFFALILNGNYAPDIVWIETEEGQKAIAYLSDWVERESEFHAPIFKDVNTPNVSNPEFSGDTIKGKVAKITLFYTTEISGDFYIKTLGVVLSKG